METTVIYLEYFLRESRGTHHKQTRRSGHAKDSARTLYGWLHEEGGLRYLWALWESQPLGLIPPVHQAKLAIVPLK